MFQLLNKIQPHKFFLIAAIILGIVYNIVTPPLQVPDEYDHFRRVYHLSEGNFLPQKNGNRLGGEMPVSFKEFVLPYRHAATNLKYTLTTDIYKKSFSVDYDPINKKFDDFPNTSYYNVISYLPQTIAVFIIRHFEITNAKLYYVGRLAMFLVWIISMFFLIKTIPVCKWLFTMVVLLPMNVYLSNSFSADTVTNILSFTFVVLVLKYAFDEKEFNKKRLGILLLIGVLLALSKIVYVGLILSFFIIPISKFKNKKQYVFFSSILFIGSFIAAYLWSGVVVNYFTPYYEYDPAYRDYCCLSHCANYEMQKQHILLHRTYFFEVIYNSLFRHPYTYLAGYIGSFGNNDIPLPRPVLLISYLSILLVAFTEKSEKVFSVFQKLILISAAFLSFVLLLLSQHLTWDCVGEGIVDVVQGRYLTPLFPLLFFAFTNKYSKIKFNPGIIVIGLIVVANAYSFKIIFNRYLSESYVEKTEFYCGAEEVIDGGFYKTSNTKIFVEGALSQNDSVARSGKYSAMLSPASPYCFTYKFKNLNYGDMVEVSAWQKGSDAQMIFTGKGTKCGEFYLPYSDIAYEGEDGWKRMHYVFTMNIKCQISDSVQVTFFMWNPNKTKTYIDDLKLSVKKFGYNYLDHKAELF